jgi:poly-gamma-glutamate capsule biosynthesis protein CapA/YwtB (metallophosphatase superfamily)
MADVKMTKAMWFEEIKAVIAESDAEQKEEMMEFIDKQVELLEAKAEKAKERAAAKKEQGDALREVVQAVLTEELQTIDAIAAQIEGEDVTKAKVTARLSQLVKAEIAVKETVTEDKRKLAAYKLA